MRRPSLWLCSGFRLVLLFGGIDSLDISKIRSVIALPDGHGKESGIERAWSWAWVQKDADARLIQMKLRRLAPKSAPDDSMGDALRHFLGGLQMSIPADSIPSKYGVQVKQLSIGSIDLRGLESKREGSELFVSASGIHAAVNATIETYVKTLEIKAKVVDSVLSLGLLFTRKNGAQYPDSLQLTSCAVNPKFEITLTGSGTLDGLIQWGLEYALRTLICPKIESSLPPLASEALRNLSKVLTEPAPSSMVPILDTQPYVNMQTVPILQWIDNVVKWDIGSKGLNRLSTIVMNAANRSKLRDMPLDFAVSIADMGVLTANVSKLSFKGADSFTSIALPDLRHANDTFSLGMSAGIGDLSLVMDLDIHFEPDKSHGTRNIVTKCKVEAGIRQLRLLFHIAVMVLTSHLPSKHNAAALTPQCLLPAVSDARYSHFDLGFHIETLKINPIGKPEGLEQDLDTLINHAVQLLLNQYRTLAPEGLSRLLAPNISSLVTPMIRESLDKARMQFYTQEQLNALADHKLPDPDAACVSEAVSDLTETFLSLFQIAVGTICAAVILVWQVWAPLLDRESGEPRPMLPWQCLAAEPSLNRILVLTIPFAIVATILAQLYAHSMVGVQLWLQFSRNNLKIDFPPVADFTVQVTAATMWQGGERFLAVATVLVSWVFPYSKLIILLFAWVAPIRLMSTRWRGRLLHGIEATGKISYIDFFITALGMVSQRMNLKVGEAEVNIFLRPARGFFISLTVTILTFVYVHMMVGIHDRSAQKHEFEIKPRAETMRLSILEHNEHRPGIRFPNPKNWSKALVRMQSNTRGLEPALLCAAAVLFLFGINVNIVSFEHQGLVSIVLGTDPKASFSVMSLISQIPYTHGGNPSDYLFRSFQLFLFILGVFVEALYIGICILVYFVPIFFQFRKTFASFAHMCHAWAALDILVASNIIMYVQLPILTQLSIGDSCDAINDALAEYAPDLVDDPVCFNLAMTLEVGFWLLLAAAILTKTLGTLLIRALEDVVEEMDVECEVESCTPRSSPDAISFELGVC